MSPDRLPASVTDVDAAFLSAALATPVARVDVTERVEGTTGRVRIRAVTSRGDEHRLFVKTPARRRRARLLAELPSLTAAEVRFYGELAGHLDGVPHHRFAGHGRGRFAVVLDDLTDTHDLHDGGHVWTLPEAEAVVDVVAALHARFLGDPALGPDGSLRWLTGLRRREDRLGDLLAVPLTEAGLRRAGDLVPKALRPAARRHARRRRRHMRALAATTQPTVIHADLHPGNVAFTRDAPPQAVLCDWQLVRSGPWSRDLAYLIATGLDAPTRRDKGADLVARHRRTMEAAGADPGSAESGDLLVRAHTVVALEAMIITLGVGGLMDDQVIAPLVSRTAAAVADLDGFAALDEIVDR